MIRQIRNDIKRYVYSKASLVVVLFSMFFVGWHVISTALKDVYIPELYYCPISVYDVWLGSTASSIQSFAYFLILPIICMLASGTSLFEDHRDGYYGQLAVRLGRTRYLLSRYMSMFIYGGMAFVIPLIADMLIMSAFFPHNLPESINGIGPCKLNMFGEIYYTAPLLYTVWMLLVNFLFAGGMSGIALFGTMFSSYKYEPVLISFAAYFGIYCISNLIDAGDFSPNYFLLSDGLNHNGTEFLISLIVFTIFFALFMKKGLNYEV